MFVVIVAVTFYHRIRWVFLIRCLWLYFYCTDEHESEVFSCEQAEVNVNEIRHAHDYRYYYILAERY